MMLSFGQIGLGKRGRPRSDCRVYTVCHSVCIVWTHYSMVEPHSSNFRVITTNILGVRISRKFTVKICCRSKSCNFRTYQHDRLRKTTKSLSEIWDSYNFCLLNEPKHDKINKWLVCPVKTDQPWHPPDHRSESLLSDWRRFGSLATHKAHSELCLDWVELPRLI